jgi:adenylate cyclase class IV
MEKSLPARNVEIKARIADLDATRAVAAALTSIPSEILHQTDTFLAVPHGRLKVREFSDGSGELIAYERSDQPGPKESVYTRVPCESAKGLVEALVRVLPLRGVVIKRRELFFIGRTRVHLDRVDLLGAFLELEVVLRDGEAVEHGEREADALLDALKVPRSALVAEAYVDLLERST